MHNVLCFHCLFNYEKYATISFCFFVFQFNIEKYFEKNEEKQHLFVKTNKDKLQTSLVPTCTRPGSCGRQLQRATVKQKISQEMLNPNVVQIIHLNLITTMNLTPVAQRRLRGLRTTHNIVTVIFHSFFIADRRRPRRPFRKRNTSSFSLHTYIVNYSSTNRISLAL